MAVSVTHTFHSAISDDSVASAAGEVLPSHWNAAHTVTGLATVATSGLASDLTGTLPAGSLPNPSASTLGGIESLAAVSHQWINQISTSGVPSATQPAFTDISGSVASTQMPALTGDITTSAGFVATTLATVNSNTGSWGLAASVAQFTVNAKGLITAAANVAISIAVGAITGLGTGVATALGANVTGSGGIVLATNASLTSPALDTPSAITLTNATGLLVAGGGTGIASATAYAVLCGGTTTTNPFQSVASVGSTGQVLTSNGAGLLPTFKAAGGSGGTGGNIAMHTLCGGI
jgi:hypothetical protein